MTDGEKIIPINIEEEMKTAYIDYSMSVIVSRALPDARDGLKPVHRRVLYGMLDLGLSSTKPYKKSARIVGEVLGKYHPHGDSSVYDAMVRMAQDWSLRYPLIDGQGNFGSMDGDSPAAMRYTEVRFKKIAEEMLADGGVADGRIGGEGEAEIEAGETAAGFGAQVVGVEQQDGAAGAGFAGPGLRDLGGGGGGFGPVHRSVGPACVRTSFRSRRGICKLARANWRVQTGACR